LDETCFLKWLEKNIMPGFLVLEIGCGTGRQTLPTVLRRARVVGIDISEEMLLIARKKLYNSGCLESVDFILGDAEDIPLKNQIFDACEIIGTLHHLQRPDLVLQNALKKIIPRGAFFSYDPHGSPIRFIFDWLMRIWKLYDEENSGNPLFSERQLLEMLEKAGIKGSTKISTYLPPHVFQYIPPKFRAKLLEASDNFFNSQKKIAKFRWHDHCRG
jgi:SAM-dependent methyltransferase